MSCVALKIGNSISVRIVGLKANGVLVDDAVCSVTVKTAEGAIVAGAEDIALTFTGTPGEYLGVLPSSLTLVERGRYQVEVTASKSGATAFWDIERVAKKRT